MGLPEPLRAKKVTTRYIRHYLNNRKKDCKRTIHDLPSSYWFILIHSKGIFQNSDTAC